MSTRNSTRRFVITAFATLAVAGSGLMGTVAAQAASPQAGACNADAAQTVPVGRPAAHGFKDCTGPYGVRSNQVWGHLPAPDDADEAFLDGLYRD